jgi:hypothetical protein
LERRLANATAALAELPTRKQGKKPLFHAELIQAAAAIVTREGVGGLLESTARAVMTTRPTRAYRGRPAREEHGVFVNTEVNGTRRVDGKEAGDGVAGLCNNGVG